MNKICKEMNKLWPILKFLWYDDDNKQCRRHPGDDNNSTFLQTAELKFVAAFTTKNSDEDVMRASQLRNPFSLVSVAPLAWSLWTDFSQV